MLLKDRIKLGRKREREEKEIQRNREGEGGERDRAIKEEIARENGSLQTLYGLKYKGSVSNFILVWPTKANKVVHPLTPNHLQWQI